MTEEIENFSSAVEAAARAMYESQPSEVPWEDPPYLGIGLTAAQRQSWLDDAQAALTAAHVPEMVAVVEAGRQAVVPLGRRPAMGTDGGSRLIFDEYKIRLLGEALARYDEGCQTPPTGKDAP